ncbi:kinase-like domain-containing protein, partial [Clohesyomyces aquaticus]
EEKHIPLRVEKVLGHSATALVESVHCRRIRLARKTIKCSRRLHKEDAIKEVQTLQRLQHQHIVRVVGTYTLKKDLSILLYPATEYNLEEFMDEAVDHLLPSPHRKALERFFGCLSTAVSFLHDNNVKHMDIKPKNLLVRNLATLNTNRRSYFRIYIADFGISRSYQSPSESETDSPTSFTRTYAAPEVVIQDKRGFSADIFSLGCVFAEMLATL